ncbi:hypothetical protein OIE77_42645 [Streptomyces sp. NBC_01715]|uniref:hypothetical protein n=1 Tax=Streptomyces sp. NBC_01715 TaxID=2975916 RepID=UPI002E2FE3CF|nr:hypothetical protein [Streptomyces sp. NBC_01715]
MGDPSTTGQPAWSVRLWRYLDDPHRGWVSLLYSDARVDGIDGGETIGPYRLTSLGAAAGYQPGQLRPVLELASWFRHPDQQPAASGSADWTGLSIHQEIAALASLILGIRLRGDDPRPRYQQQDGSISTYEVAAQVVPSAPSSPWSSPVLPGLADNTADLGSLRPYLESLPRLTPHHTVQLVRAARQYADALWMAEGEPELAWLMLVSAVEVAATAHQAATEDYTLLVKDAFPLSAEALVATGGEERLAEAVATEFDSLLKSTVRFLAFAWEFLPNPPDGRTADPDGQLPWSRGKMRKALSTVYRLRSGRLHAGTAFPWPLLIPPPAASDGLPAEVFTQDTYGSGDTTWPAAELPMTLAVFAHLVRGMLLRWWTTLTEEATRPDISG